MADHDLLTDGIVLGAPTLDDRYVLQTDGVVLGAPVLPTPAINVQQLDWWPFPQNWESSVTETFEFLTDVIDASRKRREQRRALRVRPRKKWGFESREHHGYFREAHQMLANRYDEQFYYPIPVQGVQLSVAATAGQSQITLSGGATPSWVTVNEVYALTRKGLTELVRVTGEASGVLSVGGVLDNDWSAGAYFRPTDLCRFVGSSEMKILTDSVAGLSVDLEVDPQKTFRDSVALAGTTFDGREVFTKKPNWRENVGLRYDSSREMVDFGRGAQEAFSPSDVVARTFSGVYLGRDRAATKEVVDFFCRMHGRQGEFYMPSWTNDLVPDADLTSAGNTFRVAGRSAYLANTGATDANSHDVNKAVAVLLKNGSHLYRKITGISRIGEYTYFTVDSAWGSDYAKEEISMICFMPLMRFASDVLTLEWRTSVTAQFKLSFFSLEYQGAES